MPDADAPDALRIMDVAAHAQRVLDLLQAIGERLTRIESTIVALGAKPKAPSSTDSDSETLSRLLPAIGALMGSANFTVSELGTLAETPRGAGIKIAMGELSAHALGQLLARARRAQIAGLRVEHLGSDHGRAVWRLVSDLPADP